MLKKTMTYKDFNDVERTEDFFFNLTEAEAVQMEASREGGMKSYLEKIIASPSTVEIMETFKKILLKAYGKKSEDGRRFIKSPEISEEFEQTPAFSMLYMELLQNPKYAAEFMNAVVPDTSHLRKEENVVNGVKIPDNVPLAIAPE